jgi:formylmethanofuran dehydrogenase subunit E
MDVGKHAFALAARNLGRAVRVCLRADALEADPEHLSLIQKVQNDEGSPEERARFRELHGKRAQRVLEADGASLFTVEEIPAKIPAKALISESGICDLCGGLTKMGLLREIDGKKLCIPCAGAQVPGTEDG